MSNIKIPKIFCFTTEGVNGVIEAKENELANGYIVTLPDGQKKEYYRKQVEEVVQKGIWTILTNVDDLINQPTHYHQNGIDVIGFSELQFPKEELKGFYRINCLKYITRFDRKGGLEDLKKANFYLGKLLEMEGNTSE